MDNKHLLDREMIIGMVCNAATNVKRAMMIFLFLGLITLNLLSLTSATIHSFLYKGLAALPIASYLQNSPTEKNKKLIKKNKMLKQKIASRKAVSKKIARRIANRTARATTTNVASVFTESIPVYGIAFIVATTAYEVNAACENLKDMDEMLIALEIDDDSEHTQKVCGQDVPSKEEVMKQIQLTQNQYIELQDYLDNFIDESSEKSREALENFRQRLNDLLKELIN